MYRHLAFKGSGVRDNAYMGTLDKVGNARIIPQPLKTASC